MNHGLRESNYDVYMSDVTTDEIGACKEPKRSILFDYISEIKYTHIEIDNTIDDIEEIKARRNTRTLVAQ